MSKKKMQRWKKMLLEFGGFLVILLIIGLIIPFFTDNNSTKNTQNTKNNINYSQSNSTHLNKKVHHLKKHISKKKKPKIYIKKHAKYYSISKDHGKINTIQFGSYDIKANTKDKCISKVKAEINVWLDSAKNQKALNQFKAVMNSSDWGCIKYSQIPMHNHKLYKWYSIQINNFQVLSIKGYKSLNQCVNNDNEAYDCYNETFSNVK